MRIFQRVLSSGLQLTGRPPIFGPFALIVTVLMMVVPLATAMDNQALIEAIRAHDSQITDLEYGLEVVFMRSNRPEKAPRESGLAPDDPILSFEYKWRWKGEKLYQAQSVDGVLESERSYDGEKERYLHYAARNLDRSPSGYIRRSQPKFGTSTNSPWGVALRIFNEEKLLETLQDGRAAVQPEQIVEQGHECILVEGHLWNHPEHGPGGHFKLWLDPKCGFMPRRFELVGLDEHGERIWQHVYSDYELIESAPGIWYPVAWEVKVSHLEDGHLQLGIHNRYRPILPVRVNQGLSDDQFVVDFPMGTRVLDRLDPDDDSAYIQYVAAGASVEEHLEGMSALIRQAVATDAAIGDKKASPSLPVLTASAEELDSEGIPLAAGTGRVGRSPFLLMGSIGLACLGLIMLAALRKRRPSSADRAFENNATQ